MQYATEREKTYAVRLYEKKIRASSFTDVRILPDIVYSTGIYGLIL